MVKGTIEEAHTEGAGSQNEKSSHAPQGSFHTLLIAAAFSAVFIAICLIIQLSVGAFVTDRGQTADEAAHFVTSLMLSDYLPHLGENPIAFAKTYYAHLPRVAIGHWPPFFEALQSLVFDIFVGTNGVAMALQAVIAGLLAGIPAAFVARKLGLVWGLLTGLMVLCSPFIIFLLDTDMADNLLGLLVFLSACAWSSYERRRSVKSASAFALVTAAAILTKGTAFGLLLLPIISAALKRDLRCLLDRKVVLSVAAILALTIPWYAATYRLAASGWVYSWGWDYTGRALPAFAVSFLTAFGLPCTVGFVIGLARVIAKPASSRLDVTAFVASAIAMFLFILIVPADLTPRYLIPIYPCAAIVAIWGISGLCDFFAPKLPRGVASAVGAVLVLLSIWQGFRAPHVESFHTPEAVAEITQAHQKNFFILVSGSARFEGAMIASLAQADRGRFYYALRGSKLLASSNFMGSSYKPRFASAAELQNWLIENQIGWIIVDRSAESMAFEHNGMLLSVLAKDAATFRPVWRSPDNDVHLFQTPASSGAPTHPEIVLADQAPAGVP